MKWFGRSEEHLAPGWNSQPTPAPRFGVDTERMKAEVEREAMTSILGEIDVEELKDRIVSTIVEQMDFDKLAWAALNKIHDHPSLISALNAQKESSES